MAARAGYIASIRRETITRPTLLLFASSFNVTSSGRRKSGRRAVCCLRGGQISVQRRGRYSQPVGNVRNGDIGIGEQRPRNVEVVLSELRRSASCTPRALRGRESGACALPNEGALKLRKRAEHVKDQDDLRGCPDICSMKIFSHPASLSASCRRARFWSSVETRA